MSKQQTSVKTIITSVKSSVRNLISVTLLLALVSGAVVGARAWSAPAGRTAIPFLSRVAQSSPPVETVSVVLGPHAFTPAAVTRAAESFRLEVQNQSGAQGITLQLRRDGGGVVHEWTVPNGTQTWSETVDLAAGGYDLVDTSNPACIFHITVQ